MIAKENRSQPKAFGGDQVDTPAFARTPKTTLLGGQQVTTLT